MWVEKQTFGSVAEYDRYKAEILGRVRPRSGTEGKIHNRLLRERMQERYRSPENVRKWNQWKAELEAVGKTPAAMAEELERLEAEIKEAIRCGEIIHVGESEQDVLYRMFESGW